MLTHSDDLSKEPLLESKPSNSDNAEKRLKHSMGMTRQREWQGRHDCESKKSSRLPSGWKRSRAFTGIFITRRVREGFQQKDLTTNNANGTNRNTVNSSFV